MRPNLLDLAPFFLFCVGAAAIVGSLVGAILLRAAAEFAEKLPIEFGDAFLTVFFATLINSAISFAIGAAYAAAEPPAEFRKVAVICLYPIAFLVQSAVISARHNLPYWKGLRISFYMAMVWIVIFVVVAVVVVPLLYFMGALHR